MEDNQTRLSNKTRTLLLCGALVSLACGPGLAFALGIGQIQVRSALNQRLTAEIELLPDNQRELNSLTADIAYQTYGGSAVGGGANRFSYTVDNRGGRSVLRITSERPVREPLVNLLVELQWNTGRMVREFAVFLDPAGTNPNAVAENTESVARRILQGQEPRRSRGSGQSSQPARTEQAAPPPAAPETATPAPTAPVAVTAASPDTPEPRAEAPAPQPLAAAPAAVAATPARGELRSGRYGPVAPGESLWRIAERTRPEGVSTGEMMQSILRANPQAFVRGNPDTLMQGVTLEIPGGGDTTPTRTAQAAPATQPRVDGSAEPVTVSNEPQPPSLTLTSEPSAEPTAGDSPTPAPAPAPGLPEGARIALADDNPRLEAAGLEALQRRVEGGIPPPEPSRDRTIPETPAVAEPEPGPAVAEPEPGPRVAEPEPGPAVAEPEPGPAVAEPEPGPEVAEPPSAPVTAQAPEASTIHQAVSWVSNPDNWAVLGGGLVGLLALAFIGYKLLQRRRAGAEEAEEIDLSDDGIDAFEEEDEIPTTAGADNVDLEKQTDPLERADMLLELGDHDQAETVLRSALDEQPDDVALQNKLLDVYYQTGDAGQFRQQAAVLAEQLGNDTDHPQWQRVARMGRELAPDDPLFAPDAGEDATRLAGAGGFAPLEGGDEDEDEDATAIFDTSPAQESAPPAADSGGLEFDFVDDLGEPSEGQPATREDELDQAFNFDFDDEGTPAPAASASADADEDDTLMNLDEAASSEAAPGGEQEELGDGFEGLDFGFDDETESSPEPAATQDASDVAPAEDDDTLLELNTDNLFESEPAVAEPEEDPLSDELAGLDFDMPSDEEPTVEEETADDELFGGADDNDAGLELLNDGDAEGDGEFFAAEDYVETKLDLANAYIDMEDPVGARSLLEEVLKEGNSEQQQRAEALMQRLS